MIPYEIGKQLIDKIEKELAKADHDIENNIVFWHEDEEDE